MNLPEITITLTLVISAFLFINFSFADSAESFSFGCLKTWINLDKFRLPGPDFSLSIDHGLPLKSSGCGEEIGTASVKCPSHSLSISNVYLSIIID